MAAAAAAVPVAVVVAVKATGSGDTPKSAGQGKTASVPKRRVVSENDLPGDPNWKISQLGAPDAMLGYTGQSSVLPGEPVTLYASRWLVWGPRTD